MTNTEILLKAAQNAKINLTREEQVKLISEIDEILRVFSKIDTFKTDITENKAPADRKLRKDEITKSSIDPFSNTKLIQERKFRGPRLVE